MIASCSERHHKYNRKHPGKPRRIHSWPQLKYQLREIPTYTQIRA